jgi:hypothetical protein
MKDPNSRVMRWLDPVKATLARCNYRDLRADLILAIIDTESSGNPWAWNSEPKYRWLWNVKTDAPFRQLRADEIDAEVPPIDFPSYPGTARDQEWWGQQSSFGLLQVMGAAAREQGFRGQYLTELADPVTNIEYGVKHLWNYAYQYGNRSTGQALARWNSGGRPDDGTYAAKVMKKLGAIEAAQDLHPSSL